MSSETSQSRFIIEDPYLALLEGDWLKQCPSKDVYQILCDIFRLRQTDDHRLMCSAQPRVYPQRTAEEQTRLFKEFLEKGSDLDWQFNYGKAKIMPKWWT